MIERIKNAVEASGKSYKTIATLTGISESSVSRYLNGEQTPPFDFVAKIADELNLSLDDLVGNSHADKAPAETTALEQLRSAFEQRIADKNDHIDILKINVENVKEHYKSEIYQLETDHDNEIERIERIHAEAMNRMRERYESELSKSEKTCEDLQKRIDKKDKQITWLFVAILCASLVALYCVTDALHGDWGIIRYQLYAYPSVWNVAKSLFDSLRL